MACPAILKRRRKSSVSATFCLSPLPKIGEGFREWSEAPSYEEGVGGDGGQQGSALQKGDLSTALEMTRRDIEMTIKNPRWEAGILFDPLT